LPETSARGDFRLSGSLRYFADAAGKNLVATEGKAAVFSDGGDDGTNMFSW